MLPQTQITSPPVDFIEPAIHHGQKNILNNTQQKDGSGSVVARDRVDNYSEVANATHSTIVPQSFGFNDNNQLVEYQRNEVVGTVPLFNSGSCVDINTSKQSELEQLKGVGAKTAEAIILFRTELGVVTDLDQLLDIKGIGQKWLDKNRDQICPLP